MPTSRHTSREERLIYRRRLSSRDITWNEKEVTAAYNYLTNPVKEGVWKMEAKWLPGEGITHYIRDELEKAAKNGFIKLKSRTVKVSEGEISDLIARTESFTFLFTLFVNLLSQDEQVESLNDYLTANEENDLIMSVLDIEKIRQDYGSALTYFKENLYYDGLQTRIGSSVSKVKDGMFYVSRAPKDNFPPREYSYQREDRLITKPFIELLALEKEPLGKIAGFLDLLGKTSVATYYKIFSPEEELLSIYTKVTRVMLPYVVSSKAIKILFNKIMSDYEDENATATISTAGQVGEECLTQIYETLYKKPVPQNMTLGALRDSISDYTKKMKKVKPTLISNRTEAQKEIKDKLSNTKTLDGRVISQICKILLELDDLNHKTAIARIRTLEGLDNDYSIFPHVIRMNLNNLLRLRNIVSHKSIDPVGMAEALQSVYYSLSLYIWWDTQRKKIDWNKDERGVIQEFISAATGSDK